MDLNLLPRIMNKTKISVLNKTGVCSLQIINVQISASLLGNLYTHWLRVRRHLHLPCDGREGCPRLGLLGAGGSPWVGDGQGLLRGEGRGEVPGPEPAPGSRCCGTISSTSSSTSPGTVNKPKHSNPTFVISTLVCVLNYNQHTFSTGSKDTNYNHSIPSMS